ncbi:MAG: AAA family ATPase [Proteobacteria bacterium]|nr:AAA family ATPase [Pseudomonadota bacterium]
MTFSDFVGHEDAKLALILNAVDFNCGGVLFVGEKGSGKTTLSRLFRNLLPEQAPFVEIPLNITEDVLLGGIDMEETIQSGRKVFQHGILSRAHGGVIYIDDINLLSQELVALIIEVQGRGENIIEREGLTLKHPSRFILIASMNPEEGALSPHLLDRFGMCVLWEGLRETSQRIEIMRRAMQYQESGDGSQKSGFRDKNHDKELKDRIYASRSFLKDVAVPPEIIDYITQLCIENYISGHRGDIYLTYAARAYAAYCNQGKVREEDVDAVVPLVLIHRKRMLQNMEQERHDHEQREENQPQEHEKPQEHENTGDPKDNETDRDMSTESDGTDDFSNQQQESSSKEEVFETGRAFKTRRLIFRKDRVNRSASGRRTKTRSKDKGGRYVKSILQPRKDIAIDATIRAAAPYQKIRGRKETLLIYDEDLRYRQRERKMGHLVVFVVDGSGSMGVQKRMIETKGAIRSLLMECYQKRDKVSMIVFRKDRAKVILPPSSSVELASKRLRNIPVGGKTPLSAGLLEAYNLIRRVALKSPETRFLVVLITDGRANHSISEAPVSEEIEKVSRLLRELKFTDYIVVDTEDKGKFIKTDLALQIASQLGADYHTIEDLRSDYLSEMVQMKKAELFVGLS